MNAIIEIKKSVKQIPELTFCCDNTAMEDMNGIINAVTGVYTNRLNGIKDWYDSFSIKKALFGENNDNNNVSYRAKQFEKLERTVLNISNKLKFEDVYHVEVPVIEGMRVTHAEAIEILNVGLISFEEILNKLLPYVDNLTAKVLSDESYRMTQKPFIYEIDVKNEETMLIDKISAIIDGNSYVDKKHLDEVFPSLRAYVDGYYSLTKLSKYEAINYLDNINKYVEKIYVRVDAIVSEIKAERFIVSKNVLNHLSYILEESARYITAVMGTLYVYNQLVDRYTDTTVILTKQIKD